MVNPQSYFISLVLEPVKGVSRMLFRVFGAPCFKQAQEHGVMALFLVCSIVTLKFILLRNKPEKAS